MKLTEEEEEAVICDEEELDEKVEQIGLCVWGKLLTKSHFNVDAMKTVLKNVWKAAKGVIIWDLDKNLFAFQFVSHADKNFVLNEGPWAFDGNILLLKKLTRLEQPSEIQFRNARFWVKVCDVPPLKQTSYFARFLESFLGVMRQMSTQTLTSLSTFRLKLILQTLYGVESRLWWKNKQYGFPSNMLNFQTFAKGL